MTAVLAGLLALLGAVFGARWKRTLDPHARVMADLELYNELPDPLRDGPAGRALRDQIERSMQDGIATDNTRPAQRTRGALSAGGWATSPWSSAAFVVVLGTSATWNLASVPDGQLRGVLFGWLGMLNATLGVLFFISLIFEIRASRAAGGD